MVSGSIYDDVATEPPYEPICGECRWCKALTGFVEVGLCVLRFEKNMMYENLEAVDYEQGACPYFEEELR